MKRFQLLPVNHPFVEVECGGEAKKTKPIEDPRKNPMFPNPILIFDTVSFTSPLYRYYVYTYSHFNFH